MGQIKLLEEHIADKIAAGEVVERPLSVVKELLENSLDAGADFVEIEIREGGTSLIRVKDNGKGMDVEDLKLAFQRHATSKIREFQDLYQLNTFGFRGEALPSIAAVAQVEMTSCTAQETIGHKIRIDGGNIQEFSEATTAPGSVMEVKNLFYNIPARRKFLKSSSYEAGLIGDLVSKYAMGHPNVRFRYVSNGKLQLDTAGLHTVEQRIAYVYGNNLEKLIVPVDKTEIGAGRYLEAWLVREEITRNNRGQEVFFVNDRLVKSAELSQTLEESYYTLISKGRFPVALIKLTMPGSELDVNIHPAKTEIKINGYEQLKPKIIEVLKDALWEANITKNAFLPETVAPAAHQQQTAVKQQSIPQITAQSKKGSVVTASNKAETLTDKPTEKSTVAQIITDKIADGSIKRAGEAVSYRQEAAKSSSDSVVAEPEKLLQWDQVETPKEITVDKPSVTQDSLFSLQKEMQKKVEYKPTDKEYAEAKSNRTDCSKNSSVILQKKETVQVKDVQNLTVIGQLNNAFILAQNEEGLYIIDQHTCHERILYEKFMKAEAQKDMISQPLLIPVTINLSAQQDSILMQHIFTLRELGFVLENFGDRCYLIRSLPLGLHELTNVEEFFIDLLHDLEEQKAVTTAVIKEKLLITASCKGAVKANWPLTEIEMRTLLHDLSQVDNAHTCPHGRPIIYKITMQELYKIFKRGTYHG